MDHRDQANNASTIFVWKAFVPLSSLFCVLIVFGNGMTIIAVWRTECLRTITCKFIASLAAADLLSAYSLVCSTIGGIPQASTLFTSELVCLSRGVVMILSFLMSLLSLKLIAMDRFIYIIYSLHYHRLLTGRRADTIIVSSWAFGIVFSALVLLRKDDIGPQCDTGGLRLNWYGVTLLAICFSAYMFIIAYYWKIFQVAMKQRKSIRSFNVEPLGIVTSSDIKFLKVMLSFVGVLTLCWLPFVTVSLINMLYVTPHGEEVARCLGYLLYVNAAVNIFVYAAWDQKFRRAYKKLLFLKC